MALVLEPRSKSRKLSQSFPLASLYENVSVPRVHTMPYLYGALQFIRVHLYNPYHSPKGYYYYDSALHIRNQALKNSDFAQGQKQAKQQGLNPWLRW